MSNVKTGDLAWLITSRTPYPVCEVGPAAQLHDSHKIVFLSGDKAPPEAHYIGRHWWCKFREPLFWGYGNGRAQYSDYFPVSDRNLRKITGPSTPTEDERWNIARVEPATGDTPIFTVEELEKQS